MSFDMWMLILWGFGVGMFVTYFIYDKFIELERIKLVDKVTILLILIQLCFFIFCDIKISP